MRHYSILEYANFRWFKLGLALAAIASLAYLWHRPALAPYGGTWLGYTLGTIGALLILWLLWYGVRKRSYRSNAGTVQGWYRARQPRLIKKAMRRWSRLKKAQPFWA